MTIDWNLSGTNFMFFLDTTSDENQDRMLSIDSLVSEFLKKLQPPRLVFYIEYSLLSNF